MPLYSPDRRENFWLDLNRGRIDLKKVKMQNRGRQVVALVRLDLGGPPHRNPDGKEIAARHLHLYREGFGDKWAFPLPADKFGTPADVWEAFQDFLRYCNPAAHTAGTIHMIDDIQKLLNDYQGWLKDRTVLRQIDDWVEITTPYLDRHNDYVQIYARKTNGSFTLTDDGYTIDDLEQGGCRLDSRKRQDLLKMTLNGFGVQAHGKALEVHATPENFAVRKHNLVQAILAVNDMFCLAAPMVTHLFYEDVEGWLDLSNIRYTPRARFTGKSGFDHLFDFVIPKSRQQPERIVQTINRPNRDNAEAIAFAWIDTKEVRSPGSRAYALLNDTEQALSPAIIDALSNYDVHAVPWSRREDVLDELAA